MATNKPPRRVYSAEQLQRLRASCSQPKLREAIEELDGEDAELVKGMRPTHAAPTSSVNKLRFLAARPQHHEIA